MFLRGFFTCNACNICIAFGKQTHSLVHNGSVLYLNQCLKCVTSNVIYCIQCSLCDKLYIGETSQPLKNRIRGHLSNIRNKTDTNVALHFNSEGHSINDFKFFALRHNSSWSKEKRLRTECKLINKFCTYKPWGMNEKTKIYASFLPIS